MINTMNAALYARVSTRDKGQDPEMQLTELREFAAKRGWQVVGEFVDLGVSGSKDSRPQLDAMLRLAKVRKLDVIAVMAELERELIRERVKAGLAHARSKGQKLGRPKVRRDRDRDAKAIRQMRADGESYGEIGEALGR